MRIASLVPSTTEIVCALGLGDELVARTHECDYPPEVKGVPAVTADLLAPGLTPAEIDVAVARSVSDTHTIYALDADALQAARPDVVLTQSTCAVCAVDRRTVDAVCSMGGADVVSYDPTTLDEIFHGIAMIAKRLGVDAAGDRLLASLRDRLRRVQPTGKDDRDLRGRAAGSRPRVAVVEWPDPVYAPGHWVPDLVEAAGGSSVFGTPGGRSVRATVDELINSEPEVVVLAFCGYDRPTTERLAADLPNRPDWRRVYDLGAPVVVADGSAHFSRPGPRVVDGVADLAAVLRPEAASRCSNVAGGHQDP